VLKSVILDSLSAAEASAADDLAPKAEPEACGSPWRSRTSSMTTSLRERAAEPVSRLLDGGDGATPRDERVAGLDAGDLRLPPSGTSSTRTAPLFSARSERDREPAPRSFFGS
jgi:hypothetical protein